MPLALIALALGAFGIGTTEFVIVGLLPQIAGDFSVSIPSAGMLVTGYALGVVVGAPLMTAAGSRLPRKTMLAVLMALFIAGNLLCAFAGSYTQLMTGRLVAALTHGAFFGIGSVVAAGLVAPARRASAIALMFTGLTVANVLGVPLGTFLGQHFGWRSTFWAVTAFGVVGLCGITALVPRQERERGAGLRGELAVFRRPQVWLALLTTTLGFAGVFASFTYVAPMMTEVAGFPPGAVTWLLVLFGAGLCVGNVLGGRAADRSLMPSLYVILAALAGVLLLFVATARTPVSAAITLAALGAVGFATVPPLQMRVMQKAEGAPALASAANIAAFNLGNAVGAWLGGLTISHGLGYTAPNWVGALLAVAGLAVAALAGLLDRRTAADGPPPPHDPPPHDLPASEQTSPAAA
ncbi:MULTISPECIES: MFS transporter [Kitasatospora]|uniref:Putative major facilitator superfamily transporter n=1 Tax=Kitasatospora setae (strain ATCC 33774 / DSM 43861 / JCM 3304 / KCC A-0304 / NBRC 14216 / KM-6054) TaxID=452652 RepID=E4MZ38_KITSK|nr:MULTISPECIES: MFS transporter [Kitasatospora]BAJ25931.1 putative major facilitator superfamily transporter [Kitasatospora setae KM-6054]BAJ33347.1 putative major facilitator superfamily transporter [Kitasatospora setae KM-6054]